ncbi:MAG: DUF2817 domain-containing protein [Chitinophagaceae bacterium]|nr:DUF2817 domain-containing protein [Rubrivivax sp.]
MDTAAVDCFSQSYEEARGKFLAAATRAGLAIESHLHPLSGRDGEALAMDVARLGVSDSAALLIVSSACHGVEGFCGSGVQNALLGDSSFHTAAAQAGVAVLYVHALNPHGFSWWRRTTHENVDLNRNWQDFSRPLPANPGYDELADAIVPPSWPPAPEVKNRIEAYAQAHGPRALQTAITAGQYRHATGLFFGGQAPTWSRATLTRVLLQHATRCRRLAWIDLHTGLGPSGHGEHIFAGRPDPVAVSRARAWWGDHVTSTDDGSSSSTALTGTISTAAYELCPQAEYTGIALEYGTLPLPEMLGALRADQWRVNHPEAPAAQRAAIERQSRDAFYVDTPAWKQRVLEQGLHAARAAVAGLAGTAG